MTSFVDPQFLSTEGPKGFVRQLERLLVLCGSWTSANIDGPGDHGADLLGRRKGEDWVFQAKWKKSSSVDEEAVNEVHNAMQHFSIHRGVVATNTRFTRRAIGTSRRPAQAWCEHFVMGWLGPVTFVRAGS